MKRKVMAHYSFLILVFCFNASWIFCQIPDPLRKADQFSRNLQLAGNTEQSLITSSEICANNVDDDGNGLIDCEDFNCHFNPVNANCNCLPLDMIWACSETGSLFWFSKHTGGARTVGNMNVVMADIAWTPAGKLYGIGYNDNNIYEINPTTAAITPIFQLVGFSYANAMTSDAQGNLYIAANRTSDRPIYRVNMTNGALVEIANFGLALQSAGDLAFFRGDLYCTLTSNRVAKINVATGAVTSTSINGLPFDSMIYGIVSVGDDILYLNDRNRIYNFNPLNSQATFNNFASSFIYGMASYNDNCGSVGPDNQVPSTPANLHAAYSGRTFVSLVWANSIDNVAVTGYDVYMNNVFQFTVSGSNSIVSGLSPNVIYVFSVRARDAAGNRSLFSNPVSVTTKSNGLNYRFYQGDWTTLPDFNALSPAQTGNTPNVDLAVRPPGIDDDFGFVWEGYIHIPAPGGYTFETISDDGSKFYFNNFYSNSNTALVNNDGLHPPIAASGTINIPVAGLYPIAVTFFERFSGQTMEVYWTGPGIPRQLIPGSAFTGDPQTQLDTSAPGTPGNLHVVSTGTNYVTLDWDNSTDNVGVEAYDVYRDGVKRYTTVQSEIKADGLTPNTSYGFTVKARDAAGNSSSFSNAVAGKTTIHTTGLDYRYYEGNWDMLPDFNALTPVQTGTSSNVDIGVRPAGHDDHFGFVWEGYINIPTSGTYTFEILSDDGSKLFLDNFYDAGISGTVGNDGVHHPTSAQVTLGFNAGFHSIALAYFEKVGGEVMQLYWTGPGIPRQLVPNSAFNAPPPPTSGLSYRYYEGTWDALPDFNALTPVQAGTTPNVDIGVRPPTRNDLFGFVWEGYINIPTTGGYTFETISDDGSKLYFNSLYSNSATATVNNDGLHPPVSSTGNVTVAAGAYPIAITFFEKFSGETMQVYWTGPGIPRQLIPNSAFTQAPPPVAGFDANRVAPRNRAENGANATVGITKLYPNPFTDRINIEFFNSASTNNINVGIYDVKGRLIYTHHAGKLPAGNTTLKVNLGGQALPWGIYMVGLDINGQRAKMMKLVKSK